MTINLAPGNTCFTKSSKKHVNICKSICFWLELIHSTRIIDKVDKSKAWSNVSEICGAQTFEN